MNECGLFLDQNRNSILGLSAVGWSINPPDADLVGRQKCLQGNISHFMPGELGK